MMLADCFTPVSIFLKLRDHFARIVLLESSDYAQKEGSFSYLAFDPIASLRVTTEDAQLSLAGVSQPIDEIKDPVALVEYFLASIEWQGTKTAHNGIFGFTAFDAIARFEPGSYNQSRSQSEIPLLFYDFYRFVLVFDHFRNQLQIIENCPASEGCQIDSIIGLLQRESHPSYTFMAKSEAVPNITDEAFKNMVDECKQHCQRGDVFQIVPSRSYSISFRGDDFQVYRKLRSINPSPYLFYFDFGSYRIFGSSPEAQIIVDGGKAELHPIAGTIRRTMDDEQDKVNTEKLLNDPKENAEHIMLVDLARNDLNKNCTDVKVTSFREVQYFSHVIHLVSRVSATLKPEKSAYRIFSDCFPQGTLSGAPKYKAIEIIEKLEPSHRGFYGGAIGKIGFDNSLNHAIMIRSFYSKNNVLKMQAGAGIVIDSNRDHELKEVSNKLRALQSAVNC